MTFVLHCNVKYTSSSYQFCGCLGGGLNWHIEKPCDYSYLTMHLYFLDLRRICFFFLNLPFPLHWFLNINGFIYSDTQVGNQSDLYLHSSTSPPNHPTMMLPNWPSKETYPSWHPYYLIIFPELLYPCKQLICLQSHPFPSKCPMVPQIHTHTHNYFENSKKKKPHPKILEKITIFAGLDLHIFQRSQARCLNRTPEPSWQDSNPSCAKY